MFDQYRVVQAGIQPVFEELKLVLIGSQGAGKNAIGNAIFREKIFTLWTSYKSHYVKETRTVSGTQIHLARTPGWKGDLSRSEKTKYEIVHCVQSLYNTGPHAVLLALKVNSELPESTIQTLESLLTDKLWDHTIVLFTNGEKLGGYTIEDHIRCKQLQPLIDKCGERYFVVQKKDSNQITDTIEELIIRKNSARCFKLSAPNEVYINTLLSDWIWLVTRIKSKIDSISAFKENLCRKHNTRNNNSVTKLLRSKDDEIRRLNNIVQEKEKEIVRLRSGNSRTRDGPDLSALNRRIAELEHQLDMKCKEVEKKDTEIEELKTQLQIWKTKAKEWRTHEDQRATAHADMRSRIGQNVSKMESYKQIPLPDRPSNRGEHVPTGSVVLREWGLGLCKILDELSDAQLKKMQDFMHLDKEWNIPRRLMEGKNRGDLVDLIIEKWGQRQSVLKTQDLIKKIPRNDDCMIELFRPFLNEIGDTW
ncbi:uncharacterized protein [Pseudorasbora parva]|uniref:uncharacterized protein n=1 Tax=Pseudorasbora parva TaxID=51549 RepID=UPI00351E65A3